MNLNIRYDDGVPPVTLHVVLANKITDVVSKLEVDVEHIEWLIYEATIEKKIFNTSLTHSVSRYGFEYGFYIHGTKRIWISTKAIMQSAIPMILASFKIAGLNKGNDLLANVVMDELAHEKTQKTHGDKEYDDLLLFYHRKYYGYWF